MNQYIVVLGQEFPYRVHQVCDCIVTMQNPQTLPFSGCFCQTHVSEHLVS